MDIKVLGMGCCNCRRLYDTTNEVIQELGIDASIEKIEDMSRIMGYGVMRTPALVVDEKIVIQGRTATKDEIRKILLSV